MVTIIKQGKDMSTAVAMFKCSQCTCEFSASRDECKEEMDEDRGLPIVYIPCPNCKHLCYKDLTGSIPFKRKTKIMNIQILKAISAWKKLSVLDRVALTMISILFFTIGALSLRDILDGIWPYEHSFRSGMVVSHVVSDTKGIVIECDRRVCLVSTGSASYMWNVVEIKTLPQN